MKPRLILVSLGLLALAFLSFTLQAQEGPIRSKGPNQATKESFKANQQQLQQQYKEFKVMLFKLKQKMARGSAEDKKTAEHLDKILQKCDELAITQEFAKMEEMINTANIGTTDGLRELETQSAEITKRLDTVFEMFRLGSAELLSQDRKNLQDVLKDLQRQIDVQKQHEAQLARGKTDAKELSDSQKKEAEKTAKLAERIQALLDKDKDNKKGQSGEANLQGNVKDKGKADGKTGESKSDGAAKEQKESPRGESRDGGKDSQAPKGESKPAGEKSPSKAGGDKSPPKSDSKPGSESKGGKEGSPSPSSKESKSGAKGAEGSAKENKGDKSGQEAKPGDSKDSGAKPGEETDKKDSEKGAAKGDDKQGSESSPSSPSDSKEGSPSSESKPGSPSKGGAGSPSPKSNPQGTKAASGSAKAGDAAGESGKAGQGSAEMKNGAESQGYAQAKDGGAAAPKNPNNSNPQGNQAADKGDSSPPPPPGSGGDPKKKDDNNQIANSQKKVKEAGYDQSQAGDKIATDKKEDKIVAAKKQADAIQKMEEAKKKLERLLNQLREDEMERVLAALQARCEKMLKMQQVVLADTELVDAAIAKNADKKPNRDNKKFSGDLAGEEKKIVEEANKCIDILQAEGTAVAFPEVFQQVRDDMLAVQKRLDLIDPGQLTQNIEKDIIVNLKEMIEALKKARDELKDKDSKSPPPGSGGGQPGDQKLLELIQELKMVRSLQKRVNDRTINWGRALEQSNDPQTVRELRNLSERQRRIQGIVDRIAKGDNK